MKQLDHYFHVLENMRIMSSAEPIIVNWIHFNELPWSSDPMSFPTARPDLPAPALLAN